MISASPGSSHTTGRLPSQALLLPLVGVRAPVRAGHRPDRVPAVNKCAYVGLERDDCDLTRAAIDIDNPASRRRCDQYRTFQVEDAECDRPAPVLRRKGPAENPVNRARGTVGFYGNRQRIVPDHHGPVPDIEATKPDRPGRNALHDRHPRSACAGNPSQFVAYRPARVWPAPRRYHHSLPHCSDGSARWRQGWPRRPRDLHSRRSTHPRGHPPSAPARRGAWPTSPPGL